MSTNAIDDSAPLAPPALANGVPDDTPVPSLRPRWGTSLGIGARIPGNMDAWAALVIALSCAITPLLISTAMSPAWPSLAGERMSLISRLLGYAPLSAVATMALIFVPRGPAPRWVRAAVLIPVFHLVIAAFALWLWHTYAPRIDYARIRLPLAESLPAPRIALIAGALVLAAALLPARRRHRGRVPRWIHSAVVLSLAYLLCLGLWLPITAHMAGLGALTEQSLFAWITLAPPALLAVMAAATTWLAPAALTNFTKDLAITLPFGVLIGVLFRLNAEDGNYLAYANMIHVLLSAAVFSLACIAALAIAHIRALIASRNDIGRRPPWVQLGTIEVRPDESDVVAWMEHKGWLGGLSTHARRFRVRTERGMVDVPPGAHVVTPIPAWTTSARAGDKVSLVRAGDLVCVTGYIETENEGPYRQASMVLPGNDGVLIWRPRTPSESAMRDLLLVVWRPCALYLLVTTAIAIPGLIARFL